MGVTGAPRDVIQSLKLEPRIICYKLSDCGWTTIKPMLAEQVASNGSSTRLSNVGMLRTRHDKRAANYLAYIKLASIRVWLRANEVLALRRRPLRRPEQTPEQ